MKRDTTTQTIWRTVVFAGAMLGTPACKAKPAATTPNNAQKPSTTPEANAKPDPTKPTDPADPCTGDAAPDRPRGADDDGGGGTGRGFVLS
jgi:hypothetical protein